MKSRNIKTRLAAFGLALLMGLSPLGNLADVHAAETKNPSEPVTESAEISETEQTEEVSEAAKHLVTAGKRYHERYFRQGFYGRDLYGRHPLQSGKRGCYVRAY